jgi:uncharacterized protein YqgC (DUF456 family)
MWDSIINSGAWTAIAWVVTVCLLIIGLVGSIIPILPGHLILILAAFGHWLMLKDSGVEWWTFVVLILLAAISQTLELISGAVGTRWFGGSRLGAVGALIGGILGLFFFPIGLILGPLAGAFFFEWAFTKKTLKPATVSGVGSVAGTLGGMLIKMLIGILMVGYFLIDVLWL